MTIKQLWNQSGDGCEGDDSALDADQNARGDWIGEPPFESGWSAHMRALLGKQVNVTIDRDKPVIVSGTLLSFNEGGECAIRHDDGFVTWCWPALDAQLAT